MEGNGYLTCYFCGQNTVKRSYGDKANDTGRLELYCTSQHCDARETTLIVLRDGNSADARADVRVLRALDDGHTALEEEPSELEFKTVGELMNTTREDVTLRRIDRGDVAGAARSLGR